MLLFSLSCMCFVFVRILVPCSFVDTQLSNNFWPFLFNVAFLTISLHLLGLLIFMELQSVSNSYSVNLLEMCLAQATFCSWWGNSVLWVQWAGLRVRSLYRYINCIWSTIWLIYRRPYNSHLLLHLRGICIKWCFLWICHLIATLLVRLSFFQLASFCNWNDRNCKVT